MKTRKIGVWEVPEGDLGAPYIGCAGWSLGLETRPLAALPEACFVQVPQLQVTAMKSQRFAPLIYGEPICKLHRSPYGASLLVRPAILQPSSVAWGHPRAVSWLRPYPLKVDRRLRCQRTTAQCLQLIHMMGGISTQIQQRNQSLIGSGGHRSHSKKIQVSIFSF